MVDPSEIIQFGVLEEEARKGLCFVITSQARNRINRVLMPEQIRRQVEVGSDPRL